MNLDEIARRMQMAVNSKVFPGAVLLVSYENQILFHEAFGLADIPSGQLMQKESVFDLASLTKPLATALCIMKLVERGLITVEHTLGQVLPETLGTDKAGLTIDQLLRHTSGLPAHRPFYERVIERPESERQQFMRGCILQEPLISKPGEEQIYSDLGYMLLSWIIEHVSGSTLDQFSKEALYKPVGVEDLFFMRMKHYASMDSSNNQKWISPKKYRRFVSTELCSWREKILRAEVHDDNAWAVGGVDGHAGLFGTAAGVLDVLVKLMGVLHGIKSDLVEGSILKKFIEKKDRKSIFSDINRPDSSDIHFQPYMNDRFDMVAGFDTPSLSGSSAGRYFSPKSIGHLGFTGTSFWMDPLNSLIVILLSNRIHLSRKNQKIKKFRPEIHDTIFRSLIKQVGV